MPPFEYLYNELKRKHVTLKLLWDEYREHTPDGYRYSQFCVRYRAWVKTLDIALRQTYRAGVCPVRSLYAAPTTRTKSPAAAASISATAQPPKPAPVIRAP